jgi:hypothetical protein
MDLILAEKLLLLMLDDEKGTNVAFVGGEAGPAGALLLDLTAAEAVTVDADGRLEAVAAGTPPQHPLLREAHAAIAGSDKRRDTKGWVGRLPKDLKPLGRRLSTGLVERGVLSEERRKLLGIIPTTRFPEADPVPEQWLRERLRAVLLGEREPEGDDGVLVALLVPYDLVRRLVPNDRRREAKARAKEVADAGAAGDAVAAAVRDTQVAVTAAVVAAAGASVAAGAGGGA